MAEPTFEGTIVLGGDDSGLLDALTHKQPIVAVTARGYAAGIANIKTVRDWVKAEVDRGTDLNVIYSALLSLQMSLVASVVGNLLDVDDHEAAKTAFIRTIEVGFLPAAAGIRAQRAKQQGQPGA